jgi:hypothetical protein
MNANEYLTTVGGEVLPLKKSEPVFVGDVPDIARGIIREVVGNIHMVPAFKRMREQIETLGKRVSELEFQLAVEKRAADLGARHWVAQRQELAAKIRAKVAG